MNAARAFLLPLALCAAVTPASAAGGDSTSTRPAFRPGRHDAEFALVSAGAIAVAASADRRWSADASGNRSGFAHGLAATATRFGNPVPVGAALLAADGLARLAHREGIAAASERMAFACVAAGTVTLALKAAAGRERPYETSSPSQFRPFSGHDAFPSGHTTLAFALAASLDAEARSPWVRVIAYPAAAFTGWARVHDRKHWPSDVVAGAAIGGWCAYRADGLAQRWFPRGLAVVVLPRRDGANVTLSRRF